MVDLVAAADSASGVARIAATVCNEGYSRRAVAVEKTYSSSSYSSYCTSYRYRPHDDVRSYWETGTILTISKRERGASVLKREQCEREGGEQARSYTFNTPHNIFCGTAVLAQAEVGRSHQ